MIQSSKALDVFATKSESGGRKSEVLHILRVRPGVRIEGLENSLKRFRSGMISTYHDPHNLFDRFQVTFLLIEVPSLHPFTEIVFKEMSRRFSIFLRILENARLAPDISFQLRL